MSQSTCSILSPSNSQWMVGEGLPPTSQFSTSRCPSFPSVIGPGTLSLKNSVVDSSVNDAHPFNSELSCRNSPQVAQAVIIGLPFLDSSGQGIAGNMAMSWVELSKSFTSIRLMSDNTLIILWLAAAVVAWIDVWLLCGHYRPYMWAALPCEEERHELGEEWWCLRQTEHGGVALSSCCLLT